MSTTQDDADPTEQGDPATKRSARPTFVSIDDVNRYAADGLLVQALIQEPVDHRVRNTVAGVLIAYGKGTLVSRMVSGRLGSLLRDVGVPYVLTHTEITRLRVEGDYRAQLADWATADAFIKLEDDLRAGTGWSTTSRRNLGSYFVSGTVFALTNLLRADRRRAYETGTTDSYEEITDDDRRLGLSDPSPDLEDDVATRISVGGTVRELEDVVDRLLVFYKAQKYTEREIAELIGRSPKAVERRWARLKKRYPWIARIG